MREALKLALEVMLNQGDVSVDEWIATEKAIKEALTQPEQEPVAWANSEGGVVWAYEDVGGTPNWTDYYNIPLYTTPPQRTWVGLSREDCYQVRERESDAFMYGVAWAEAKLKEKNT